MFLAIYADYIDIFLSNTLDLRSKIVCASKILFFFHLWKLWLKFGDHDIIGNAKKITITDSFVSNQCFLDVQISNHFVVLLILHFRDKYSHLHVPCT